MIGTAVDLIDRARAGDDRAWQQLIEPLQQDLFRLAYLVLRDPAEAADVQQEALLRAWLKLEQFDSSRPLRPWLMQIALNLARNRRRTLRRAWARVTRLIRSESQPEPAAGLSERAIVREQAQQLWRAVQQLPVKGQTIVYLRYFLDLTEEEAAAVLEIPKGTVKSRTSRALTQLRGIIQRDFVELEADFVGKFPKRL
ncbi:MAG: RNA polymerase sigma factor [Ardenticatenaceae bacterium]|nr:RNA polymerase sigma factor [Ardenticatenaceae bacterium]